MAAQCVKPISYGSPGDRCFCRTPSDNAKSSSHKSQLHLSSQQCSEVTAAEPDEIRSIDFELNVAPHASGSVLVSMGQTRVICGVTIEEDGAALDEGAGSDGGWITAEYSMLPYSTQPRKPRDITRAVSTDAAWRFSG